MTDETPPALAGTNWSAAEIGAVVSDYFAMFGMEVAGPAYNKREHNRALQAISQPGVH